MTILWRMIWSSFIALMLIAISAYVDQTRNSIINTLYVIAVLFLLYTCAQLYDSLHEVKREDQRVAGDYATAVSKLDPQQFNALGMGMPTLHATMYQGDVIELFEDTHATVKHFIHFLDDSNDQQISPRRNWTSGEYPQEAWHEIKTWLASPSRKYIFEDSARGNHSWLWRGGSYRMLCTYWLARNIPNMADYDVVTPDVDR
jgi:hypothetical protein